MSARSDDFPYPCAKQGSGIITFAEQSEVDTAFTSAGRFKLKHEIPLLEFVENGCSAIGIERQAASNLDHRDDQEGLAVVLQGEEASSNITIPTLSASTPRPYRRRPGDRIPWGKQGDRRSSMLRNVGERDMSGSSASPRCPTSGRSGI